LKRKLSLGPVEISPGEIEATWEKLEEHTIEGFYAFYRSPSLRFRALVDSEGAVAILWSVRTGLVYQADARVMRSIVDRLMGITEQTQTGGVTVEEPRNDGLVDGEGRAQP
jgi:hypothetical protein